MKLSANQAARAANVSGTTITRAIKAGKLSAVQTDDGTGWLIDPAELDRWQSNRTRSATQQAQSSASQPPSAAPSQDAEIRLLREMLDEMRRTADHWREMAERQSTQLEKQGDQLIASTRLIEDLTKKQNEQPASWWDRLRGKPKAA